jgi:hypothetical protein
MVQTYLRAESNSAIPSSDLVWCTAVKSVDTYAVCAAVGVDGGPRRAGALAQALPEVQSLGRQQ